MSANRPPPIKTARLILRTPSPSDLADILAYRNHPDRNRSVSALEPDDAVEMIEIQSALDPDALPTQGAWLMFVLEHRTERRVIGEAGLFLSPPARSHGDLGWWLHPDHRGRGLATEAARAMLEYAFQWRQIHRVTAQCHPENHASKRVMQHLGMRHEGTSRQSRRVGDDWHDELLYALLRSDWRSDR